MKKQISLYFLLFALIAALVGVVIYLVNKVTATEAEMTEMVEMMDYEKERLENEFADVALEMEGISIRVNNDSLLHLIDKEHQRVEMLLQELRTVKATNARRINELKQELSSVRKLLVYYIAQVDSLSEVNSALVAQNKQVTEQYEQATIEMQNLTQQRDSLEERVTIASKLDVVNIKIETTNEKGRKRESAKAVDVIKISYTITKNVTAKAGMKTIYLRLIAPNGNLLYKKESDLFAFEDKQILYSARKNFEYQGEHLSDVIYYTVTETLTAGEYKVELFVDGNLVGNETFTLKK